MTSSREPGPPSSGLAPRLAWIVLAVMLSLYPIGYVYARVTHALVNYGGFISHPNAMSGWGGSFTWQQLVFAPCVWAEGFVRGF